jgi:hypothetical protein
VVPTKVVCLTQVVSADELRDDEEYEDIMEDMRTEGEKYGKFCFILMFVSTMNFVISLLNKCFVSCPVFVLQSYLLSTICH